MTVTNDNKCNECNTILIETEGEYNKNIIYQYCPKCKAGCGFYEINIVGRK